MRQLKLGLLILGLSLLLSPSVFAQGAVASSSTPSSSGGSFDSGADFTLTGTWDFSGATAVTQDDEAWIICDDGTPTKCIEFEASSITAANTSTLTVPQGDFTLSGLSLTQTWTGTNTFSGAGGTIQSSNTIFALGTGGTNEAGLEWDTGNTPDTLRLHAGTTSRSVILAEFTDTTFDFNNGSAGTSAQTDPTLIIHSANQSTTEWIEFRHNQTHGVIATGTGGLLGWRTAITANTGTATPANADTNTCYTNTGDADGSAVTLPDDPTVGTTFCVLVTAAQTITISPSAGESLYMDADQCVANMTAAGVGANTKIIAATGGSGAIWIATGHGFTCNDV